MTSMTTTAVVLQPAFGGIDTHKATHHAAVIDADGRRLDDRQFPTSSVGIAALLRWFRRWDIVGVGVEQTGTYGAGVSTALLDAGLKVADVNAPDRRVRASVGKSDPIDAVMAAEAVRTGRATAIAKDRRGVIEAIRSLHAARSSAIKARTAALAQLASIAVTAPTSLRDRVGDAGRPLMRASLRLRPDLDDLASPEQASKVALRSVATRIRNLDEEIAALDALQARLVRAVAPRLLARPQVGIQHATQLLLTAGEHPDRIRSDAAFARLTGVAPIPASSGKTNRMRLHRGGDRQANKTIYMIAIGRLKHHQPAIDYLDHRMAKGHDKSDAIRAMKRLIARELHGALKADLRALDAL